MRFWWVNQNQTYKHEVQGGFLWSPKLNNGGGRNLFYENMTKVGVGDIVLSFSDTLIKAVGVVQGLAQSSIKPDFGSAGGQWSDEGWYVPVEFKPAPSPVRPKNMITELLPHMASKYAPLQQNGNGNQGVYLTEISQAFAEAILSKLGVPQMPFAAVEVLDDATDIEDDQAQQAIQGRTDIGATYKEQLIHARRGQGVFRANVRLNETGCRFTGVDDPRFLVASHIKPWRECDDQEKLDGCNGLLLSPHVDRLFDRGLISFRGDGTVLRSTKLPAAVWAAWSLDKVERVVAFSAEQDAYLEHHRSAIFEAQ